MALSSRTVWSIVALVVINGVSSVSAQIPTEWLPSVNLVLGLLGAYFRVNPRV